MFADVAPKPGDIVSVRTRQYLVEDVQLGDGGDLTLVRRVAHRSQMHFEAEGFDFLPANVD